MKALSRAQRPSTDALGFGSGNRVFTTATLILALFVFLCQSVVLQAHVHAGSTAVSAPSAGVQVGVQERRSTSDQPADCPLCRELAQNGAYLSSGQITVSPSPDRAAPIAAASRLRSGSPSRSHAWRSRAPPTLPNA